MDKARDSESGAGGESEDVSLQVAGGVTSGAADAEHAFEGSSTARKRNRERCGESTGSVCKLRRRKRQRC